MWRECGVVWGQVAVLLACWGIFVTFQLLLSRWPHCSGPYWAIYAVQAALCLAAEVAFLRLVRIQPLTRLHCGAQELPPTLVACTRISVYVSLYISTYRLFGSFMLYPDIGDSSFRRATC